MHGETMKYR